MPLLRGLNVHVTNVEGQVFDEWGVQPLRKQNRISAYIKAKSEEAFRITIQPQIPFVSSEISRPWDIQDDADDGNSRNLDIRRAGDQRITHQQFNLSGSLGNCHFQGQPHNTKEDISPPRQENPGHGDVVHPPFHLLASLYLDGRQRPERRVVVYLDPKHHDFPHPNGKVRLRSRWTQGENGELLEHAWVFKNVGIETVFEKLLITEGHNQADRANQLDEDAMITAMNATELGAEGNIRNDEKCSVGQIVIVIERIVVGAKWSEENYRPKHRDGQADDVNMDDLGNDITHTAKHTYFKTIPAGPISVVNYRPFVSGEGPYATFQFFYRSQEILEKFNFRGYPQSSKLPTINRLRLERNIFDLTPLSLSRTVQAWKSSGKNEDQSFDHKEGKLYHFNQHYREAVAVKEKNHSASQVKKRCSRSNALLRPIIAPELLAGISGKGEPLPPESRGKKMIPCENTSRRTEIVPSVSVPQPSIFTSEIRMTTAASHYAPSVGVQTVQEHSSSPFATISRNPSLVPSKLTAGFVMKPNAILLRSPMHLKGVFKDLRTFSEGSDADDERDATDLETEAEREDLGKSLLAREDENTPTQNQDDGGLHTDFKEMTIGKKRHIGDDDGDEGYQSDEHGGTAKNNPENGTAAQLDNQEVKMRSLPSGRFPNTACEATIDDTASTVENSSLCSKSNARKQLSAQRLSKRIKS